MDPEGMLASAETVDAVAAALKRHGSPLCVVDPVLATFALFSSLQSLSTLP